MAQIDRVRRTLDLRLVYWGPAGGGKTTTLRSVHGAFDPSTRGELSSVDTEDERTYFFDYAPLDLPRWRGFALRAHAYTVPGQEAYVETRRRILRGADAVLFVADGSPARAEATAASWRQLDDALRLDAGPRTPVILSVNKQDLPGAASGAEMAQRLSGAGPRRAPAAVVETTAIEGTGVVRGFSSALVAAVAQSLGSEAGSADGEGKRFLLELAERLGSSRDGVSADAVPASRTVRVPVSSRDPDAGGLVAALEASRWLAMSDLETRGVARERTLRKLLLDVGRACTSARDLEGLARGVVGVLVAGLDAGGGWLVLSDGRGGFRGFDPMGALSGDPPSLAAARAAATAAGEGRAGCFESAAGGGVLAGDALAARVDAGEGRHGVLAVVARHPARIPADAEGVVVGAAGLAGLAAARIG
jgi:signal recognition particle receptor subunit beta